jgi:hypothetical protein
LFYRGFEDGRIDLHILGILDNFPSFLAIGGLLRHLAYFAGPN